MDERRQKTEEELVQMGLRQKIRITEARTYILDEDGNEITEPAEEEWKEVK